jgi:spore maturation protein CgeB
MSYRFLKVFTMYSAARDYCYRKNPGLAAKSYAEQYTALMRFEFSWSDHITTELRRLGVDAADEICANASDCNRAWALEHNIDPKSDVVFERLKLIKPDVVYLQDSFTYNGTFIKRIKEEIPSVRLVTGWCCSHIRPEIMEKLSAFDFLFTCTPGFPLLFSRAGIRSYLHYHAFAPEVLSALPQADQDNDLCFFGNFSPSEGFHGERRKIVDGLLSRGIDIRIYSQSPMTSHGFPGNLARTALAAGGALISKLNCTGKFGKIPGVKPLFDRMAYHHKAKLPASFNGRIYPQVFGIDMYCALKKSRIGFNAHIDAAGEWAGNIRLFEVTGVGSCLLTDAKKNLAQLFEPDKEIVTYSSVDECVEKATWLINNPSKRIAIAQAGQKRCLKDHSFARRAAYIDTVLRAELSGTKGPSQDRV